jgi:pimeloyl-ACP methyl ester carboxylesterase
MSTARPRLRRLTRWLVTLLGVYALGVGLLMFFEDRLLYRVSGLENWSPPGSLRQEDVYLTTREGIKVHGWWCPCERGDGVILYFHGQSGNLSHRGALAKWLLELKRSVLMVDYPGYGKSEGSPSEQGCYDSADAAYGWLTREKKVPPSKIVVMGESLGGGIAIDLASREPCGSLVLLKTYTTIPEVAARMGCIAEKWSCWNPPILFGILDL